MAAVHPYAANRPNPGLSLAQRTPSNGSSFLAPSSSSTRPQMDRAGSHFGDTPVATNSALNKQASASSSLYQNCLSARDRLSRVPGFKARFFDNEELLSPSAGAAWSGTSGFGGGGGIAEDSSNPLGPQADPVSQCLNVLRLGSSLCFLFNKLGHSHQLDVNPAATLGNLKACQRGTAHFIMACKQDLGWTESDLFAVNELYYQDTNGVVKVVHTVTKLLDELESLGVLLPPEEKPKVVPQAGPSDERSLVVREILDSERKYMQDLEVLQDYQRQLQMNDILTQDQIHSLFINLNKLADFQRRFLIGVESNASLAPMQQRFGHLFLLSEENFACYEPYCANLTTAQDLAIAENAALSKLSHVLDPVSELAPLLIKPVQRICKYPLLLSTLLKNTPTTNPYYDELKAGLESIMRVTDRVNEEKRRKENLQAVEDLGRRVEDWKGHDINSFGDLLLQENFIVIKNDNEREYQVYLFERIICCCKEVGAVGKKDKKSNSILKRPPSQRINKLQLKGRIFVNNITGASQIHHRSGQYLLEVRWRGDTNEEAFTIKCRTEELLKQWQKAINKAVEDAPARRRAHHMSGRRSERGINSPASQFPPTPMSEFGPSLSSGASNYSNHGPDSGFASPHPQYYHNPAQPSYPPNHHGFDDEGEDLYEHSESGRSTPSTRRPPGTRSLPAEYRDGGSMTGRPRAQTEDANSNLINQWRSQTPGTGGAPNLPRGASHSSTGDGVSLRSSASSRQLRSQQSAEWIPQGGSFTSSPGVAHSRLPADPSIEETTPRLEQRGGPPIHRQASHPVQHPTNAAPPMLRNRSASSPNVYQLPNGRFPDNSSSPQLPQEWQTAQQQPYPPAPSHKPTHKNSGASSGGTVASQSSASVHQKRFSSSSTGTNRTSGSSLRSGVLPYSSSTSPSTTYPGSVPPSATLPNLPRAHSSSLSNATHSSALPTAVAVRVKVFFGEDTFVVVVLDTVLYAELVDKVLKKIRMCGGDRARVEAGSLKLKYQDEDGDRIKITSQEDVAMAFETAKSMASERSNSVPYELILHASIEH
ncbi:uncharacterized protein JCM6883_004237 [Sporobolomyces salmoneus]|uniref:uncharacterized protein n=1 Tax=Sporobolomyces salmoneus TaxID=183962 RepID=UPI003172C9D8